MTNEVLVIQHADPEGPGAIGEALARLGLATRIVRADQGAAIPPAARGFAGLVVMGGPMSVYEADRIPHLAAELRLIEQALSESLPVLGICLGSQLLAAALGARVFASGRKEIGWHEIRLAPAARSDALWQGVPERFTAFHWHGDVFDLPRQATPLASSELTPLQAFRFGERAYGLLFHLEIGPAQVRDMVRTFAQELREARLSPEPILEGIGAHLASVARIGAGVFDRWALRAAGGPLDRRA